MIKLPASGMPLDGRLFQHLSFSTLAGMRFGLEVISVYRWKSSRYFFGLSTASPFKRKSSRYFDYFRSIFHEMVELEGEIPFRISMNQIPGNLTGGIPFKAEQYTHIELGK